jgi:hypothetical protein
MTVAELIEHLKKLPQDLPVVQVDYHDNHHELEAPKIVEVNQLRGTPRAVCVAYGEPT